ncbi:MAG: DinB family protein [candidate division Zixibacteria bacterium]
MGDLFTSCWLAEFAWAVRESSLKRLRKVPSGKENWRVAPDAMSFADTIRHLIDVDKWLFKQLEKSIPAMKGEAAVENIKNRDEYDVLLSEFETAGKKREELLRNLPNSRFSDIVYDERFGKVTVWWVIVRGNLDHEIHHRGQIAAYLRMV